MVVPRGALLRTRDCQGYGHQNWGTGAGSSEWGHWNRGIGVGALELRVGIWDGGGEVRWSRRSPFAEHLFLQ